MKNRVDKASHTITVPDMVKHLLRYANMIKLSGLYNGRAGLSLSLFAAADHLIDEKLQDIAFGYIKEALVTKNDDYSFENGLSGIGYTLLYLIEKGFLDTDYDEIFGVRHKEILAFYDTVDTNPSLLLSHLTGLFYLTKVARIKDDNRIQTAIRKFFEGIELFFTIQFHDFVDFSYVGIKTELFRIFEIYLRLIDYSEYADFSRVVLEDYATLYRKGLIASSLKTGFYLDRISRHYQIKDFEDVINENMRDGFQNIHSETLSLKEKIDLEKLAADHPSYPVKTVDMLLNYRQMRKDQAIVNISKCTEMYNPLGYGAGLSRLLIYCIDRNMELL